MKNKINQLILLFSLLLISGQWGYAQNFEWVKNYPGLDAGGVGHDEIIEADDFGNIYNLEFNSLAKYSKNGDLLWKTALSPLSSSSSLNSEIEIDAAGNTYVAFANMGMNSEFNLTKRDPNGGVIWRLEWWGALDIFGVPTLPCSVHDFSTDQEGNSYIHGSYTDGNLDFDPGPDSFYIPRSNNNPREDFLMKIDKNGNLVWAKSIPFNFIPPAFSLEYEVQAQITADGKYLYLNGSIDANSTLPNGTSAVGMGGTIQYDSSGTFQWIYNTSTNHYNTFDIQVDYNNALYLVGWENQSHSFITKINANGILEWSHTLANNSSLSESWSVTIDPQNNVYETGVFAGTIDFAPSTSTVIRTTNRLTPYIRKLDQNGNFLEIYTLPGAYHIRQAVSNNRGDLFFIGTSYISSNDFDPSLSNYTLQSSNNAYLLKLSTESYQITGNVFHDTNVDCVNNSENGIPNTIVIAANAQDTFYGNTDVAGNYIIGVDSGSYNVFIQTNSPYWSSVCNTIQSVIVDSTTILTGVNNINFGLQAIVNCPFLSASISSPILRATTNSFLYTNYCNNGTANANDAYIDITLDSGITFINAYGASLISQTANVYRFDLDTIEINECGSFSIEVSINPNLPIGQTLCNEVHIYPDSLCTTNWTGPIIQASATCQQDTVFFQLKNNGTNMLSPLNYSIFEDHVMLRTAPFTLGSNGSTTIAQAADPGKTYRIEAQQPANIPPHVAPPIAHSTVVGCNALNGTILTTGIIPQFYMGNTVPWIDINCQTVIGSYDPNDKTPQPLGYDTAHYIERGVPLDYKIRFQNTGLDSAFNIIVVDTLSPHLDITTFQMKGSSHAYTWNLSQQGILTVSYIDIRLVDSFTNEPLSHGFFSYEIQQKPNLPLGSRIENTAAIYFDFNAPIITNTTFHTIGENYVASLVLTTDEILDENVQINAFPNPFDQMTTIQVTGQEYESLTLQIVDVAGRIIRTEKVLNTSQIVLNRQDLNQGFYFYRLLGNGNLIGTGKLIAQ